MWVYLREGWSAARKQPFVLLTLIIYQFVWGFVIYRFVQSIIDPLLYRFPGGMLPGSSVQLFFAESEFRLFKTDLAYPYLWWLGGFLALKMLLTPVINAGIYFSLHQPEMNGGYRFLLGVKELFKPFLSYYLAQMVLTLLPLYWLIPRAGDTVRHAHTYQEAALSLLPGLGAMLAYGLLLHLLFTMAMLNRTTERRWSEFWGTSFRSALPILGISIIIILTGGVISLLFLSASMVWAGITAFLLSQLYPFVKIWLNLWTVASQYQLWTAKM